MWDFGLLFVWYHLSFHTFRSQSHALRATSLEWFNLHTCMVFRTALYATFLPFTGQARNSLRKKCSSPLFPSCLQYFSSAILILIAGKLLMWRKLSAFGNNKGFSSARKCCIAFMESWYGSHYDHELVFQLWPFILKQSWSFKFDLFFSNNSGMIKS